MAEKQRITNHNSRTGDKGKIIKANHNDRNFDVTKAEHINKDKCAENYYWQHQQVKIKEIDEQGNVTERPPKTFAEQEKAVYEDLFSEYVESLNAKAIKSRHKERVQTIEHFRTKNIKGCPEEVIFSVGNKDNPCNPEILKSIYEEYAEWHKETFPNIILLNAALHVDEASPHIQIRKVWLAHENGMNIVNQEKALAEMGIERPNLDEPVSRRNNAKMTYTSQCRQKQIEIAKSHGLDIEDVPREPSKSGMSLLKYKEIKIQEETEKLKILAEQSKQKITELKTDIKRLEYHKNKAVLEKSKPVSKRPETPTLPPKPFEPERINYATEKDYKKAYKSFKSEMEDYNKNTLPQYQKQCEIIKAQQEDWDKQNQTALIVERLQKQAVSIAQKAEKEIEIAKQERLSLTVEKEKYQRLCVEEKSIIDSEIRRGIKEYISKIKANSIVNKALKKVSDMAMKSRIPKSYEREHYLKVVTASNTRQNQNLERKKNFYERNIDQNEHDGR